MHELRLRSKTVYLCGDYNIDLLKIDSNEKFSTFYENTTSVGFVPKITLPTRICETTSTLIDNIYTNVIDKSHTSGILITPISDHQMYFCTMNENFDRSKNAQKYVEVEFCNQENMDKFKNEVANADLYNKLDLNINTDPNYNYEIFSKHLQAAKSKHIPKKIKKFNKRKHKKEKWMTNELLIKIVEKNKLYVKWKTTPINLEKYEEIKKQFKECEKNVIKLIKEAKQQYFDRIFTAYRTDFKKTWRTISETLCRNKKHCDVPSRFFHDGKELSEPKAIANAFNVYFANIGKNLAATIEQDNNADFNYMQYLGTPTKTSFNFHCITEIETMKAIDTLENKSSSGHDGISNKIVKLLKNEISKPLTVIINQMLKTGIFPDSFKTSKIVPLFKKGDHGLLTNYRPISLLPTISKVFERVIYDQMYLYFNNNNLLADEQFGFRKNHSTEYAAIKLVDHISNEMESGKTPVTLFIDLSKAFDTLSFDILLQKLNYYGIAGVNLKLMANYLRNRKQYVVFNNHNSEITDIRCGVPQGSILGPLFFSICINDLKNASNKCKFLMYADDTTIYFNIEDFNTNNLEAEINKELEQVNTWLKVNKLSLNVGKTKMMIFHRKRKHIPELKVLIDGCNIECVNSFNFLGIMLDQGLSWNNHVDLVKKKVSKVIGILYRLKNIFPSEVLKTLYSSLIASYLNYGLLLWGKQSHKVEILQKKAIRLITGSNYIAHTNPLFGQLKLLKIRDMFKLRLLKLYYKLCHNLLPSYFNRYQEIIELEPVRSLRQHLIHPPLIRTAYAECTPLYQLIKLINSLKEDKDDIILSNVELKIDSFCTFSFKVSRIFLNRYDPVCNVENCFVCSR